MLLNKDRTEKLMDTYKLDVLIASTPENVAYVSEYMIPGHKLLRTPAYAILPRDDILNESSLILPTGEIADILCNNLTWIKDLRPYGTFYIEVPKNESLSNWERNLSVFMKKIKPTDSIEALVRTLEDKKLANSKIGFDEAGVSPVIFNEIKRRLPDAKIIEAYNLFREIRMIKTEEEIKRLKKSVNITERAIKSVLEIVHENITVHELVTRLMITMVEEGAVPVYPSIGVSTENFIQNMPPTEKKLKRGDFIRLDVGCNYRYYHSDIARMAVLGKPTDKQQKYYSAVLEGERKALEIIKAGTVASEVFHTAIKATKESGIPHIKRHHVGHGIGIELYDPPLLTPFADIVLEENMVLNVEIPYYEVSFGGVQVEDCIIVRKNGYEMISKSSRELYII